MVNILDSTLSRSWAKWPLGNSRIWTVDWCSWCTSNIGKPRGKMWFWHFSWDSLTIRWTQRQFSVGHTSKSAWFMKPLVDPDGVSMVSRMWRKPWRSKVWWMSSLQRTGDGGLLQFDCVCNCSSNVQAQVHRGYCGIWWLSWDYDILVMQWYHMVS